MEVLGPTREEVKTGGMQSCNENILDFCASPYIIFLVSCGDAQPKSGLERLIVEISRSHTHTRTHTHTHTHTHTYTHGEIPLNE